MRRAFGRRSGAALALTLGTVAAALVGATPGRGSEAVSCAYVEAGPPGPSGNILRIRDETESVISIHPRDGEISLFNNSTGELTCTGGSPTIFNVDRIDLSTESTPFIELLAPGATAEPSGSEIEVHVHENYRPNVLKLDGGPGSETIVAGRLGPHKVGVNLNSQADGPAQDADVILDAPRPAEVEMKIAGLGGSDTLSALGGAGFQGPFPGQRLTLAGGPADDRLIGGPRRDLLIGFTGNDVLLAGRGRDQLTIGPGRDVAKGGKGPDLIVNESDVGGLPADRGPDEVYAGAGNDHVDVEQTLRGDRVRCGAGRHDLVIKDPGDRASGCERVKVIRR